MSIERIKEEAAKADQRIAELAAQAQAEGNAEQAETGEAEQRAVENSDEGVAHHAATDDQPGVPPEQDELNRVREDAGKWEQRYRSLQGMFEAGQRQIEQLHQLLAAMQSATPAKDEPAPAKTASRLVSEKDEEAFGADLIDLARRVAKEEAGDTIAKLQQQVAALQAQLSGVAQTTAVSVQERFESQLSSKSPEWRRIDADPKFSEWLQASPTRQKLFAEAAKGQDVEEVAYFFNEYAQRVAPATAVTTDPRLEKQVAPGKSKATSVPSKQSTEKKQWTRSEIAEFMVHGKKSYSSDEYARLYKDVFAAQQEGRVDFTR